jgi:hypothetical protein
MPACDQARRRRSGGLARWFGAIVDTGRLLLSEGDPGAIAAAMAGDIGDVGRRRLRHSELFVATAPRAG